MTTKTPAANNETMDTPPIVSPEQWTTARERLLVKEKELTHARDAMAAERRRMPWMAVDKTYMFDGPQGKVSLLDLFEGRRQLIIYRAFFEPACTAGRSTRALAVRWSPTRFPTSPTCTPGTRRSHMSRVHRRPISLG